MRVHKGASCGQKQNKTKTQKYEGEKEEKYGGKMGNVVVPSKIARHSTFICSYIDYEKHTHLDREEEGGGWTANKVRGYFFIFL